MSPPRRRWRREPVDLASQLGRYRRRSGAGDEVAQVQEVWKELVGPQMAMQTVVVRRSKAGVVAIACASSSWAQELDGRRDYWVGELARRCA
ncbi:MAG TPA: DciA family protein, partial [Miltoncostaeales bacterium]|nr:DciA family protein [Miltoncostaeales bacterium]